MRGGLYPATDQTGISGKKLGQMKAKSKICVTLSESLSKQTFYLRPFDTSIYGWRFYLLAVPHFFPEKVAQFVKTKQFLSTL